MTTLSYVVAQGLRYIECLLDSVWYGVMPMLFRVRASPMTRCLGSKCMRSMPQYVMFVASKNNILHKNTYKLTRLADSGERNTIIANPQLYGMSTGEWWEEFRDRIPKLCFWRRKTNNSAHKRDTAPHKIDNRLTTCWKLLTKGW